MPYIPVHVAGWKNRPDQSTPILAENLDHMEDGITSVTDAQEALAAALGPGVTVREVS